MSFTQAQEKQITVLMKSLDLTRDEAIELMFEDAEVDQMKTAKEIENDLTEEQKEGIKQNTRERSGKYEKSEEAKQAEEAKRQAKGTAMQELMKVADVVEVVKPNAEFIFKHEGVKYRVNIKRVQKQ